MKALAKIALCSLALAGASLPCFAQIAPNQGLVWEPPQSGGVGMSQADSAPFGGYRTEGNVLGYTGSGSFSHKGKTINRFYSLISAIYASDGMPDLGGAWQELIVLRQTHRVDEANRLVAITPRNVWSAEFMNGAVFGGTWQYSSAPQADINRKAFAAMKNLKSGGKANMFEIEELGRFYWVIWNSRQPSDYTTYKLGETWDWTLDEAYVMGQQSIGDFDPGEDSGDVGSNVGAPGGGLDDESKGWLGDMWDNLKKLVDPEWWASLFWPTEDQWDTLSDRLYAIPAVAAIMSFSAAVDQMIAYAHDEFGTSVTLTFQLYNTNYDFVMPLDLLEEPRKMIRTMLAAMVYLEMGMLCLQKLARAFSLPGVFENVHNFLDTMHFDSDKAWDEYSQDLKDGGSRDMGRENEIYRKTNRKGKWV